MNKSILIILSVLLFNLSYGQRIPNKPTAVSSFDLSFDEQIQAAVGLVTPGKTVAIGSLAVSDHDQKAINKRMKELMDSSFDLLTKRLKEEANIDVLPIETLKDKLNFLNHGYPIQNGFKKAAKVSDYDQFLNIQIQVIAGSTTSRGSSEGIGSVDGDVISAGTESIEIKPIINILLKFGGGDGKKFDKAKGTYKSDVKIHSEVNSVGTEDVSVSEQTTESLAYIDLLNKGIDNLIENLK